jgi:hypothetical protein
MEMEMKLGTKGKTKQLFFTTLCAIGLLVLPVAQADTVDLLEIWGPDGVDQGGDNNGVTDLLFCSTSCGGVIAAGDISDINANQFYGANGNVATAQDHPNPDMVNMLAFEGVVVPGLTGNKIETGFSGKTITTSTDFVGYVTIKAASLVWLFLIEDDGIQGNTVQVAITGQNDVSHYTEWAVSEVPLPAAAWLFFSGLIGLAGLRKSSKR